jgi:hypothetical protein
VTGHVCLNRMRACARARASACGALALVAWRYGVALGCYGPPASTGGRWRRARVGRGLSGEHSASSISCPRVCTRRGRPLSTKSRQCPEAVWCDGNGSARGAELAPPRGRMVARRFSGLPLRTVDWTEHLARWELRSCLLLPTILDGLRETAEGPHCRGKPVLHLYIYICTHF